MLAAILGLLLFGLVLLVLEAFVPGGVLGAIGCLAIGVSVFLCFQHYGVGVGLLYLTGCLVVSVAIGVSAFLFLARRLALVPPQTQAESAALGAHVGQTGRVVKTLNPTGYVAIGGRRLMARASSSEQEVAEGSTVVVMGEDSTYLIVEPEPGSATDEPR